MNASEIFGPGFAGLTEPEKLHRAAVELEAVVVAQVLGSLRKTVPEGGLFESTLTDDMFRAMLDQEIARAAAEDSPFGLADALTESLEKQFKPEAESVDTPSEPLARSPSGLAGRTWRG